LWKIIHELSGEIRVITSQLSSDLKFIFVFGVASIHLPEGGQFDRFFHNSLYHEYYMVPFDDSQHTPDLSSSQVIVTDYALNIKRTIILVPFRCNVPVVKRSAAITGN